MELSGTGVPPSLLDEVVERRSGASRGAGAAYRLVPAEIKHCRTYIECGHPPPIHEVCNIPQLLKDSLFIINN